MSYHRYMKRTKLLVATILLCGCPADHFHGFASPQAVLDYSEAKAKRLAECQLQELTREQAEQCLGEFAVAIGSEACQAADDWARTLPSEESK